MMKAVAGNVGRSPFGSERFLAAADFYHSEPKEIVIVGPPEDPATAALIRVVDQVYEPNKVVMLLDPSAGKAGLGKDAIPLLRGKTLVEGKAAACAHFSPVGNIATAMCDLWSNESVQHVPLLSGSAPETFAEVLIYDCRLMNEALERGQEKTLRDLFVSSDAYRSPQALVLSPEATIAIASAIVSEQDDYRRTTKAGLAAATLIRQAVDASLLSLSRAESRWLDRIQSTLASLPGQEGELRERLAPTYGHLSYP